MKHLMTLLFFTLSLSATSGPIVLEAKGPDKIFLSSGENLLLTAGFDFWDSHWTWLRPGHIETVPADKAEEASWKSSLELPFSSDYALKIPLEITASAESSQQVAIHQTMLIEQTVKAVGGAIRLRLPIEKWFSQQLICRSENRDQPLRLNKQVAGKSLFSGIAESVMLSHGLYGDIQLSFSHPVQTEIIPMGEFYEIRLWVAQNLINKGEHQLSVFIHHSDGINALLDTAQSRSFQTDSWIENPLPWNAFPVDLSFLNHKPAGLHGFVRAVGERFEFKSGEEIRFWGVNLSAMQCFPEKEEAEILAARLAKMGANLVRMHHLNVKWSPVRLCSLSSSGNYVFDKSLWDKLDYLLYSLKKQGIYIQMDLLVDPDEVWPKPETLRTWKGYSAVLPELIERQRQYAYQLWIHVNPYTGLAYRYDPSFVMTTIANENDITSHFIPARKNGFGVEPFISEFEEQLSDWAYDRWQLPDLVDLWKSADGHRFLNSKQADYFKKMRQLLRSIDVRIPVNGTNWALHQKDLPSQAEMDYMDAHVYRRGHLDIPAPLPTLASEVAFSRIKGKPLVVSEYGTIWPDQWRGTIPLQMAAHGSRQGWNGLLLYAYRQSGTAEGDVLRGAYNLFNDPVTMGVFPAAALLYRRGDLAEYQQKETLLWTEDQLFGGTARRNGQIPFYNTGIDNYRLSATLESTELSASNADMVLRGPEDIRGQKGFERDLIRQLLIFNTPRTIGLSGRLRKGDTHILGGNKIELKQHTIGTLMISSLDSLPIDKSRSLLITAVGRGENSNMQWNYTGDVELNRGEAPVVGETLAARILFGRRNGDEARFYALSSSGKTLLKTLNNYMGSVDIKLKSNIGVLFYLVEFGDSVYSGREVNEKRSNEVATN